ncbi:MAG: hypothetical protein ACREHV_16520 [Rhizomicrobium sp.]
MNSEIHYVDLYARAAGLLGSVLAAGSPGALLSIDVGGSFLDCVASAVSVECGDEFMTFPSLLRYRSRLWDQRWPLKPADVIQEPCVFGRSDGWMEFFDETGVCGNYAPELGDLAVRSIDSWSAGRRPLRLIHFGDVLLISDQVCGAAETLARCRPVVTFYPPALARDRSELLLFFEEMGYRILDLNGMPRSEGENGQSNGFGLIALPHEKWQELLSERGGFEADRQLSMAIEQPADFPILPRHRRSSEVFGIGRIVPPVRAGTVAVRDHVACNDCYPMETDGKYSWRWLGPRARARVALPCVCPGTYRFEVAVMSCRTQGGLGACRVLVEGREVSTDVHGEDSGTISFVGRLDPDGYAGYVEIDFVNRGSPPQAGADPRTLRMNLGSIRIAPCH